MKRLISIIIAAISLTFLVSCASQKSDAGATTGNAAIEMDTEEITTKDVSPFEESECEKNSETLLSGVTVGDAVGDFVLDDMSDGYVYICRFVSDGNVLWQTEIGAPVPINNQIYLTKIDGKNYIFIYKPETRQGVFGAYIQLITVENGRLYQTYEQSWLFENASDSRDEYESVLAECMADSRFVCGFDENGRIEK